MPLEIAYRPFTLPTGALLPAAEENVRAGDVGRHRDDHPADGLATWPIPPLVPRPRDFAARIRRRDMVSVRRRLRTPSMLRQRLAGVATIGLFAMVLGPVGWGSPGGIDRAAAQAEAVRCSRSSRRAKAFRIGLLLCLARRYRADRAQCRRTGLGRAPR
jgi:hypothetical protein